MSIIAEAGLPGLIIVVVFAASVFRQVRGSQPGLGHTEALTMLALGVLGDGIAQRMVADVANAEGSWRLLAVGTGEASANLVLAGGAALLVLAVAAGRRLAS